MAKLCPKCNFGYDDQFNFCQKCGIPLIVPGPNYRYHQTVNNMYYQQPVQHKACFTPLRIVMGIISLIVSIIVFIEVFSLYQKAVGLSWVNGMDNVMMECMFGIIQQLMAISAAVCILVSCRNNKLLLIVVSNVLYMLSFIICFVKFYDFARDVFAYRFVSVILVILTIFISIRQIYENKE